METSVYRHEYGISVLVPQTSFRGKRVQASRNVGCVIWLCACLRCWPYRGVDTCDSVHNLVLFSRAKRSMTVTIFFQQSPRRNSL